MFVKDYLRFLEKNEPFKLLKKYFFFLSNGVFR